MTANLVQKQEEQERMQEIANELAERALRGKLSAHWWLPLDEISYLTIFDEMDLLNGGSIPYGSRRRDANHSVSVNLTRMREITEVLAKLFGLTLPIPEKTAQKGKSAPCPEK